MKVKEERDPGIGSVFWCPNCNVPLLSSHCFNCDSEGRYCATDLKPVFQKEKEMYEEFLNIELPPTLFKSRNRIILNGKTLFRYKMDFSKNRITTIEPISLIKKRLRNQTTESEKDLWRKIYKSNEKVLQEKEKEAIKFIKEVSRRYRKRFKVISFSGGKDSSVTAILVKKAIGRIPLFFSDTTLEFPETYRFIEEFAKKYGFELIKDESGKFYRSSRDFFELCSQLGPPSITYRWCCTVFKSYPVNEFYKKLNRNVLAFDGIRKYESLRREKYNKISRIKKIPRQVAAYPIFFWKEADVWFYILCNKIYYNPLYEYGHTRIGCWVCPNASPFNCFMRKRTHPELWAKFEKVLYEYAKKYGKTENWVIGNYWRLRRPKKDKVEVVSRKPCQSNQTFVYIFKEPIDAQILEFFKPFGNIIIKGSGIQFFRIESDNPFRLSGIIGGFKIRVSFNPDNLVEGKKLFERQLIRAMNCVGCGGCIGSCPHNAISIINKKFTIDLEKCKHCKKCVKSECIALDYRRERKVIEKS